MIRYGILGFGLHAVRRLMPGFALATNSRVTALSRRDMKQAQASAAEYRIPHAFDSAVALCRSPEVDAIFVATPDCSLESGKPVLCEKPMGINAGECRQMVEGGLSRQTVTWRRPGLSFRTQHREPARACRPGAGGQAGFCADRVFLPCSNSPPQVAN